MGGVLKVYGTVVMFVIPDRKSKSGGISIPFPPGFTLQTTLRRDLLHVDAQEGQGLGSKAKKDWIKELNNKHKVNFLSVQETKLDCISDMAKLLVVSIYAPQSITSKRSLWSYISSLISRWDGHCMVMGDFNEVRCMEDRLGSVYNAQGLRSNMVLETWNNIDLDDKNKMVRFKKKLQILKKEIRSWVNDCKKIRIHILQSCGISVPSCMGHVGESLISIDEVRYCMCRAVAENKSPGPRRFIFLGAVANHLSLLHSFRKTMILTKIPRTCSSVVDWLRISSGSYAAGGIYHGRPLVHMLIGLIGSIHRLCVFKVKDLLEGLLYII
ncbi:RNA-directed DNA polymerase, eukaryota [Tanacetum coccineum]